MVRSVSGTVPRRDAGPELTWTYLQRVSETDLTTRVRRASADSNHASNAAFSQTPIFQHQHPIHPCRNRMIMSNDDKTRPQLTVQLQH